MLFSTLTRIVVSQLPAMSCQKNVLMIFDSKNKGKIQNVENIQESVIWVNGQVAESLRINTISILSAGIKTKSKKTIESRKIPPFKREH